MKNDRRGDIGFMEAMAGAMTVCIVMMGFVAFVVADTVATSESGPDFDWTYIDGVTVENGCYLLSESSDLAVFMEANNLRGLSVSVSSSTSADIIPISEEHGDCTGTHTASERKLVSVTADDGRSLPTTLEVRLFL